MDTFASIFTIKNMKLNWSNWSILFVINDVTTYLYNEKRYEMCEDLLGRTLLKSIKKYDLQFVNNQNMSFRTHGTLFEKRQVKRSCSLFWFLLIPFLFSELLGDPRHVRLRTKIQIIISFLEIFSIWFRKNYQDFPRDQYQNNNICLFCVLFRSSVLMKDTNAKNVMMMHVRCLVF